MSSFRGQNSTGWTIDRWREVLPAARELSDEIDGLAIQGLIDEAKIVTGADNVMLAAGADVHLPPGAALISRPLVSCRVGINLHGAGELLTSITQMTKGADGWDHCPTDPPSTAAGGTIRASDLALYCGNPAGCGIGIDIRTEGNIAFQHIERLVIGPNAAGYQWASGIHASTASELVIRDVVVNGSFVPGTGGNLTNKAIVISSAAKGRSDLAKGTFGTFIQTSEVYGWGTCFEFDTKGYHGVEGVYLSSDSCDASANAVVQTNTYYDGKAQFYQAPLYELIDNQFHTAKSGISFQAASQVYVAHNTFYIDPGDSSADWISLSGTTDVFIHDNNLSLYPKSTVNTLFKFNNCVNVVIHDNIIDDGYGMSSVSTAGIVVDAASQDVNEHDDIWFNWASTGKARRLDLGRLAGDKHP